MNKFSTGLEKMLVMLSIAEGSRSRKYAGQGGELQVPTRKGVSHHSHWFIGLLAKYLRSQSNQFEWELIFQVRLQIIFLQSVRMQDKTQNAQLNFKINDENFFYKVPHIWDILI